MLNTLLSVLGKLVTLWLAYLQGKQTEAAKQTKEALDAVREAKRQDDIISNDVDRMRTKLSDALRRKRDS
jgi:hypothetical protein